MPVTRFFTRIAGLLSRPSRLWIFAAVLVAACLSGAPARAAICQATAAQPITFTLLDVQSSASFSYGTSVTVNCTGAPGEGVNVCLRGTRSTANMVPGITFTFGAAQGSGTLDSAGRMALRLQVNTSIDGFATGGSTFSITFQLLTLDWDGPTYACASTTRVQLPVQYPINVIVNNVCSLSVKRQLAFPKFAAGTKGSLSGTGAVSATCTAGTAFRVFLSQGNNNLGGQPTTRRMVNQNDPTQFLTYGLYSDPGFVSPWGWNGGGIGTPPVQTGTGGEQVFSVYGQIDLAGQIVTPGFYSDIIIVSIAY